jgi:hypothetical protein
MQTRQKFLDSLQIKIDEQLSTEINDEIINFSDSEVTPLISEQTIVKQNLSRKKKGSIKEETFKPIELIPQIDEPFLDEPPPSLKRKISLPPLDIKPFIK